MKKNTAPALSASQMAYIALMTALLCIIGPISLTLPFSPVPVSLATWVLYLDAYILGARFGTVSCALYLLSGFAGLPVFSGFNGGIGHLVGPTGGYLIGYLFLIFISGSVIKRADCRKFPSALGLIAGTLVTYTFGTAWLAAQMNLSFLQGLSVGVLPYLPGDTIKIITAMIIGPSFKKRLAHL